MSDGDDCFRGHISGLTVWTTCLPSLVRAVPVDHQAIQQTFLTWWKTKMSEIKLTCGHLIGEHITYYIATFSINILYINMQYIDIYTYMCVEFNNTGSSVSDQYRMRFAGLIWLFDGDTVGHLLNLDKSINTINRCVYCCTQLYRTVHQPASLKRYNPRSQPQ